MALKERPILFSGPMVQAILTGRKTQTRRIVKRNAPKIEGDLLRWYPGGEQAGFCHTGPASQSSIDVPGGWAAAWCPYGKPGDRLWVRETWRPSSLSTATGISRAIQYRSDGAKEIKPRSMVLSVRSGGDWRPSIHMPRWASRITLEVTGVRVERLQDISEADAIAEGLAAQRGDGYGPGPGYKWTGDGFHAGTFNERGYPCYHVPSRHEAKCDCNVGGPTPAQCAYRELWNTINGPDSWAANPWVWVVEFKQIKE